MKTFKVYIKKTNSLLFMSAFLFVFTFVFLNIIPNGNTAYAYDPNNPSDVYNAWKNNSTALRQTTEAAEGVEAMLAKVERDTYNIENVEIPAANAAAEVAEKNLKIAKEKDEKMTKRLDAAQKDFERIEKMLDYATKEFDSSKIAIASLAREEMRGEEYFQGLKIILDASNSNEFVSNLEMQSSASRTQARLLNNAAFAKADAGTKQARLEIMKKLIEELKRQAEENRKAMEISAKQAKEWQEQVIALKEKLKVQKADLEYKRKNLAALKAQQEAAQAQFANDMANLANSNSGFDGSGGVFGNPTNCSHVTNPFGGWAGFGTARHLGTDFACGSDRGRPVYAVADGKIERMNFSYCLGGLCILINHGETGGINFSSLYQHLDSEAVGVGQWVSRGQYIGGVGDTGPATGPHLHFEIWRNGSPVNPCSYVSCR